MTVQNAATMWVDKVLDAIELNSRTVPGHIEFDTAELHAALIQTGFSLIQNSVELREITRRNPNQILVVVGASGKNNTDAMATALIAVEVSPSMFSVCMIFEGPNPEEDTDSTEEFDGGEVTQRVRTRAGEVIKED